MKKMWFKWLTVLTAALCAGMAVQLLAGAAGQQGAQKTGSLLINACNYEDGSEMARDLKGADISIDLYRVAGMEEISGGGYRFVPEEPYSLAIDSDIDNDAWVLLSQSAAKTALQDTPKQRPTASGKAGTAFSNLQMGLYLVVPHNTGDEDYLKTIATLDGEERLVTRVQTEEHSHTFLPELVALPSQFAQGDWRFSVEVNLKPEMDTGFGSVEIIKTLKSYEASSPATFVFEIKGTKDGKEVYSGVTALTFTSSGQRTVLVERIPVGATIEVREIYSGAGYKLVNSGVPDSNLLKADEILSFTFENEYDGSGQSGYGIRNHFTYDGTANQWQWSTPDSNMAEGSAS